MAYRSFEIVTTKGICEKVVDVTVLLHLNGKWVCEVDCKRVVVAHLRELRRFTYIPYDMSLPLPDYR